MSNNQNKKDVKALIDAFSKGGFFCACPCGCGEEINLKDAGFFYLDDFTQEGEAAKEYLLNELREERQALKKRRSDLSIKPKTTARAVNLGFILERIAPTFDQFPFVHNDCRSLFDPIDYLIFEGLHRNGKVDRIIFTDIKTGGARLKNNQKLIKELVGKKKLDFKTYKP